MEPEFNDTDYERAYRVCHEILPPPVVEGVLLIKEVLSWYEDKNDVLSLAVVDMRPWGVDGFASWWCDGPRDNVELYATRHEAVGHFAEGVTRCELGTE